MNKPKIQIIKREIPLDLTRGIKVYFVGHSIRNPKIFYVIDKYTFKNAVRVKDSAGKEFIFTQDDIISENELHQLRKEIEKEKLDKQKSKYADIAAMWKQGLRTAKQMADSTRPREWQVGFVSRIRAARRLGVIPMEDGSAQK